MRRAIRWFACAVGLWAALSAPAVAQPSNGQLAAVVDDRLVALNPDGTGVRALPVNEPLTTELAWSPDGNRLAIVHSGRISVYEFITGRFVGLTAGTFDANPAWSADGKRIGFKRGLATYTVLSAGGEPPKPHTVTLEPLTTQIAWKPDLGGVAAVIAGQLALPGSPSVVGAPAYAPDGSRIAFANARGLSTIPAEGGQVTAVAGAPATAPRWAPDGTALAYPARGALRTVTPRGAPRTVLDAGVTVVDWQPCVAGVTVTCRSVPRPQCSALTASVTTEVDVPVDLPAPPCSDPSGRPLSLLVTKTPENGTLTGWRYTPAAGFSGQDTLTYRMSNGVTESELIRVSIVVTRRAATPSRPAAPAPPPLAQAPYLTARRVPRLDRRRRAKALLSCDQACSLTVRLEARLRRPRVTLKSKPIKHSIVARGELAVRLRLPSKPRGPLRSAWITGRVRNASGAVREVRLPVRLPR
jgi:hypothetical protein